MLKHLDNKEYLSKSWRSSIGTIKPEGEDDTQGVPWQARKPLHILRKEDDMHVRDGTRSKWLWNNQEIGVKEKLGEKILQGSRN